MPLHSRPIPAPKPLEDAGSTRVRMHTPVLPEQQPIPEPLAARRPEEGDPSAAPTRAPRVRAESATAEETPRPWYRREPWLAAMLAAFVPLTAAAFAPDSARVMLIALTALALLVGAVMLVRQGVFGPPPGSESDPR